MSKNLTRKGLALGAVVALGTSLFAGAPAQAAPGLIVAPNSGTGYTVLASDTFTLKVLGNTEYTLGASSNLYWKVTAPSSTATQEFTLDDDAATTDVIRPASSGAVSYIDAVVSATVGRIPTLKINPSITSTGATSEYIVQAYIESNIGALGLDANDTIVSAPVTVKFAKSLTPTVTLDKVAKDQKVTGTISYGDGFNYGQSSETSTRAMISLSGASFDANSVAVTRNTAVTGFEFAATNATSPTVAAGSVIGVKARTVGYDGDTTYNYSAVAYSTADAASEATGQETTITRGEDIALSSGTSWVVRSGVKSFTYRVDFDKNSGNYPVAAGQSVQIVATEGGSTLVTGDVVRVNGKAVTGSSATDSAFVSAVTDADGGVTITVTSDLGTAADAIRIQVKATGTSVESDNLFTWTTAALAGMTQTNDPLNTVTQTIVRGSSVTVAYAIRDQFGKLWTKDGSSYRADVVSASGTQVLSQTADFVNGVATLTFTDNSTSAGEPVLTAKLKVKTTGDYGHATTDGATTNTTTRALNVVTTAQAAAAITPDTVKTGSAWTAVASSATGTASQEITRSTVRLKAIDLRSNANGAGVGVTAGDGALVGGTVTNADGSPAAGVAVTIASNGLYFSTDATGSTYVVANSITVSTTVTGTYAVYAFSQKGGAAAISITSGSVVKTQNVKFKAAAAADGALISITAPANVLPGRAFDVVVLLTDKYGAPIQTTSASPLRVALTGVGYATSIASDSDKDGKISFKVVLGATEVGTTTITATYDADDAGTTFLPISKVANVVVSTSLPSTANAAVSGSTGKFYVSVTNAAAKKVVVKVAGKFFKSFTGTAAKKTTALKAPKGKHKVTVYVSGKLVATKTITVK